jgi:hypothetical protein
MVSPELADRALATERPFTKLDLSTPRGYPECQSEMLSIISRIWSSASGST